MFIDTDKFKTVNMSRRLYSKRVQNSLRNLLPLVCKKRYLTMIKIMNFY